MDWKTWVGAIGLMGTGVVLICDGLLADPMDPTKIWEGLLSIWAGLALLGIVSTVKKLAK